MLLHDNVTAVGKASAFVNLQFSYYNTHSSDWGTFVLKTDFVLLSKQLIGFLTRNKTQTAVINISNSRILITRRFVCYATYIFKSGIKTVTIL